MNSRSMLAVTLALALPIFGCNKVTGDEEGPPSKGAGAAHKPAAPPSPLAGWTEIDLTGHGPLWKGWRVKGPPGATVKKSFDGLEIENKDGLGIVVSFTALSLE